MTPTTTAATTTPKGVTTTMMEPSSSSSSMAGIATATATAVTRKPRSSSPATKSTTTTQLFASLEGSLPMDNSSPSIAPTAATVHPEEPNLYMIPSALHPIYRPLPILWRLGVWLVSALASLASTLGKHKSVGAKQVATFLIKAIILSMFASTVLQEFLTPPSRISTIDLIKQYFLPSTLSKFDRLQLPYSAMAKDTSRLSSSSSYLDLGVHYLYYERNNNDNNNNKLPKFQALYVNHGFGASSLSWLPVLPRMVDRLQARVGVGHDAVGFGFTDRPRRAPKQSIPTYLSPYTSKGSAAIGSRLLQRTLQKQQEQAHQTEDDNNSKPIILVGHSMGSLATLDMALDLPPSTRKWIILVAPALGFRRTDVSGARTNAHDYTSFARFKENVIYRGAGSIGRYTLRRLVGGKNFWRRGLQAAWGDPKRLKDSDVLRFQWPSIGTGWESGLLTFSRAMAQPMGPTSDADLFEKVLQDENTTVTIISGSKDRVISSQYLSKFLKPFRDQVRFIEMEGMGHDPFEENVDGFLHILEQVLEDDGDRIFGTSK